MVIDGLDGDKERARISATLGVVFQNSVLDGVLTVKDNLLSRASLYGIYGKAAEERVEELSELLDFKDLLNRTVKNLSGGQTAQNRRCARAYSSPRVADSGRADDRAGPADKKKTVGGHGKVAARRGR